MAQSHSRSPRFNRKPLFDAIRRLLGRGFTQSEVDAIDEMLDHHPDTGLETRSDMIASVPRIARKPASRRAHKIAKDRVPPVPTCRESRKVGPAGIALIKRFEGCARLRRDGLVEAYPDPGTGGAPWTIGWGATGKDIGGTGRIGPGTLWTQAQCDARLESDLIRYAAEVDDAIGDAPTSNAQFDALVSFHYNTGAIHRATLTRKHVAGDHAGAAAEFARWNRAGGRVLKGLVRRRAEEAKLYAGG